MREILIPDAVIDRAEELAPRFKWNRYTEEIKPTMAMLVAAKVAECAVAFLLGADMLETLEAGPDQDRDLRVEGVNVEVKNLDSPHKHYLIYPRAKGLDELRRRRCDVLVLARCYPDALRRVLAVGYVSKRRFLAEHRIAGNGALGEPGLWAGTPFMHEKELRDVADLEQWIDARRVAA